MIGDEDMEKPKEIETNQDEIEIEAGDLETKDRESKNTRPIMANAGKGFERLEINFGGKTYDTQFTISTGEKNKYFMHDMHKPAVDVVFAQMTAKKCIKKHGERTVTSMYRKYTQLEDMKLMGSMNPDSLTISQKKG